MCRVSCKGNGITRNQRKTTERKETKGNETGLGEYAEILTQYKREGGDQDDGQEGLLWLDILTLSTTVAPTRRGSTLCQSRAIVVVGSWELET